eukprot:SAG22_NODE_599_length_8683_cov_3.593080_2_plen_430_part_00
MASEAAHPSAAALDLGPSGVGVQLPGMRRKVHGECVYLDWNATSPIFPEVSMEMLPFISDHFGNPSSGHAFGRPCAAAVSTARDRVARLVGAEPGEVLFTSCGSEADNQAIHIACARGRGRMAKGRVPHVVTTNIEHPAILECLYACEARGEISVTCVEVDAEGLVSAAAVREAMRPDETVLATVMHSNNEVGSSMPIAEITAAVREATQDGLCLVHTDAAQSIGKVGVDVQALGVDMLTIVGHKFGTPKGVAALFIRQGTEYVPMFFGGGQEGGRRAGTENVMLIAGMGRAAAVVTDEAEPIALHMIAMRQRLLDRLSAALGAENVRVNGPTDASRRLPNTLSLGIKGAQANVLLAELQEQVAASASAACHTGGGHDISAILKAMKVPTEFALGTLRLSVGRHTTEDEIDLAAALIASTAKRQAQSQL